MEVERRSGCGVELPPFAGPVHRYMESSPSCWAAYGEVLAREYNDPAFTAAHRLTVDAYAVQHPGRPSPQSIQSVGIHLISLYVVLEEQLTHRAATQLMQRTADWMRFVWLEPPRDRGEHDVTNVVAARSPDEHVRAVQSWAQSVWQAWSQHHSLVRAWAAEAQAK
jgi:Family of unknown function (DUF5946)